LHFKGFDRLPFGDTRSGDTLVTTIMYMTTLPLAEVRKELSKLIDSAVSTHQRIDVTRNGRREAVLLSAADFDALIETLDVLADADAVRELAQGRKEMAQGTWFSTDDVAGAMREAGRL